MAAPGELTCPEECTGAGSGDFRAGLAQPVTHLGPKDGPAVETNGGVKHAAAVGRAAAGWAHVDAVTLSVRFFLGLFDSTLRVVELF